MPFFSQKSFQPKRQFRFLVNFTNLSNLTFMVTKAKKPSYTMETKAHNVLNHVFKFPGVVKWDDLDVSFIDAVDPNIGSKFYNALRNAGYVNPERDIDILTGITKRGTVDTIGDVLIQQLDGGGISNVVDPGDQLGGVDSTNIVDTWTLKNAFIKSVKWGESLDYSNEGLVEVAVGLTFDYAIYSDRISAYGS
tara:strand:- start:12820 stop:13398 length:579 start_codon:yes stop_codon:yes gene_type:complete